ncbi:M48 family metalloprotease [Phenylobacterium sp.]|uniref:M48 family metalloprotease n=1 Tax=Phenylobacterium sp. TaxID=1871053 RepID=UPI003784C9B6
MRRLLLATAAVSLAGAAVAQPSLQRNPSPPPVPREHVATIEAYGGLLEGRQAAYVRQVGERVAGAAGRRDCGFHVVNSPAVNAFTAPPGCHVYITRGLLAILNSEAELAAVLGHEVGHVTANHAGGRQQRTVLSGIGALIVGAVTGSGELAQLANRFGQLNVLSYSRNQEFQADALGVRYLTAGGYAPHAVADMLSALQAEDQLSERQRNQEPAKAVPEWARTHPLTGERIARAAQEARRVTPQPGASEREEPFFAAIDGLLYGDDPEQGFVNRRGFAHPGLGVAFDAPPGVTLSNSPQAVKIEGPNNLAGEFTITGRSGRDLEDQAYQALRRAAGQTPVQAGRAERVRSGGMDGIVLPALARSQRGTVEVTVAVFEGGPNQTFQFLFLAPNGGARTVDELIRSLRRVGPRESAELRARRIEVIAARPGDTPERLAQRMAVDEARLDTFLMLNGLRPGDPLPAGRRVKVVAYASR